MQCCIIYPVCYITCTNGVCIKKMETVVRLVGEKKILLFPISNFIEIWKRNLSLQNTLKNRKHV